MNIPPDAYRAIEQEISSDTSPVGIDAKKTHVLILHKLAEIEARLERLEEKLDRDGPKSAHDGPVGPQIV